MTIWFQKVLKRGLLHLLLDTIRAHSRPSICVACCNKVCCTQRFFSSMHTAGHPSTRMVFTSRSRCWSVDEKSTSLLKAFMTDNIYAESVGHDSLSINRSAIASGAATDIPHIA